MTRLSLVCRPLLAVLVTFCALTSISYTIDKKQIVARYPEAAALLENGLAGREYWLAIPPNESKQVSVPGIALTIFVSSWWETEVSLEIPGLGFGPVRKTVKPGTTTMFSSDPAIDGSLFFALEIRESEKISFKGIRVSAERPISVYVLNEKRFTSDGYHALPTEVWDRDYLHCAYYDYPEPTIQRGSGFVIVARENNTEVSFTTRGSAASGKTLDGFALGKTYSFNLNLGQTYMIRGDGSDRAFDLSGTRIKASHPIGVISFHQRTIIPTSLGASSRDYIVEMMPPITTLGRNYISIEYDRKNKGDFFRIMASENDTEFNVNFFDKNTGEQIGRRSGLLADGQFAEFEETAGDGAESIRGVAVWQADKPILLLQYAYSGAWDGGNFDPMMMRLTPREQYSYASLVQTPTLAPSADNTITVIVQGDPDDPAQTTLRSLNFDKNPLVERDPKLLVRRIPMTSLYWSRFQINSGVYHLGGSSLLAGFAYGSTSSSGTYTWSLRSAANKIDERDTMPPEVQIESDCRRILVSCSELRSAAGQDNDRQIDQGIAAVELIESASFNFDMQQEQPTRFVPGIKYERLRFTLIPRNADAPAKAVFLVRDRAGNVSIDSAAYEPVLLAADFPEAHFGGVRVRQTATRIVKIGNGSLKPVVIDSLPIQGAGTFSIASVSRSIPAVIQPGDSLTIELQYLPEREGETPDDVDQATLIVATACRVFNMIDLQGTGIMPHIDVADWDAGDVDLGEEVCLEPGLLVRNIGSDSLRVLAISDLNGTFRLSEPLEPTLPFTLQAGAEVLLRTICLQASEPGLKTAELVIESDSPPEDDNIGRLQVTVNDRDTHVRQDSDDDLHELTLSPNPASHKTSLSFVLTGPARIEVRIFTIRGDKLFVAKPSLMAAGRHSLPVDVSELRTGQYILSVSTGEAGKSFIITVLR